MLWLQALTYYGHLKCFGNCCQLTSINSAGIEWALSLGRILLFDNMRWHSLKSLSRIMELWLIESCLFLQGNWWRQRSWWRVSRAARSRCTRSTLRSATRCTTPSALATSSCPSTEPGTTTRPGKAPTVPANRSFLNSIFFHFFKLCKLALAPSIKIFFLFSFLWVKVAQSIENIIHNRHHIRY